MVGTILRVGCCAATAWLVAGCEPTTSLASECLVDGGGSCFGGQSRFDAGTGTTTEPDASAMTCEAGATGGGDTWSSLYHDYFGASGAANCTNSGACHGSAGGTGFKATQYLCPPCDPVGCYMGIVSQTTEPVFLAPGAPFDQTNLYTFLRKDVDAMMSGIMPLDSNYTFGASDLQRISDWVAAGAKND
jgi:hypothetical protein